MICQEPVTDYRLVSVEEICALLKGGWCLYGQPFLHAKRILQPMVRPLPRIVPSSRKRLPGTLSAIEVKYVKACAQGLDYNDIAKKLHRSKQSVYNALCKLRQRWNCRNNVQLIAILLQNDSLQWPTS